MTRPNCFDLAMICPDIMCPRCKKPFQTWLWKDDLLFTCPDCNELGFSVDDIEVSENNIPENSFFTEMEWPCEDDPDPTCVKMKNMLFVEDYEGLEFLNGKFKGNNIIENYSQILARIGQAYESILGQITQ